ncbi:hypothetical protein DSCA_55580 [Desulfosarcina alkanivorans]|uniref:ATP-grasp domain-containing protein n=1 Tax=Desulfosarcina alkanivorans TaxID=571177 RepID=A0A5K7YSL1_9BACT|nr:hypothetical protein [Desulfosarcina alkanivorans]BBO71628.1 hypothetical protein DSCA_55580 [Desulfosarcina alkanivorans]
MIYYLVTKPFSNTIRSFLATWGKALKPRVRVIPYHKAFRQRHFSPGTYIFSDIERLSVRETGYAASIHDALTARWGNRFRLLNHPTRSMKRYELLRTLYNAGINSHNVFRVTEGRLPERYPVFIRGADDHGGAATALIHSEAELRNEIDLLDRRGISREDKIIVEFCDTADSSGIYRKYSALNIDGTIIPRHVCSSREWQVKFPDLSSPELIREELDFISHNGHRAELKRIFALAGIRYGRIDYGMRNGSIRVWEINTYPRIASFVSAENPARERTHNRFIEKIRQAFETLDNCSAADAGRTKNPVRKELYRHKALDHAKYIGESILFLLPLPPRHNGLIRSKLVAIKDRIVNSQ